MKPTVIKLFANCLPVKGAFRSVICDLQTRQYHFIPQALYEVLTEHGDKSIADVQAFYGNEHDAVIEEYFTFLLENGLAFKTNSPENFPALDLRWQASSGVTNAILDYDNSTYDMGLVLLQLHELNCQAVHLRFFSAVPETVLLALLAVMDTSRIRHVELLLAYQPSYCLPDMQDLLARFPRIGAVVVHGAPASESHTGTKGQRIQYVESPILSAAHCGSISALNFCSSVAFFTEALHFNSCLNRKLGVDIHGQIKNCPSMVKTFGHVLERQLQEVIMEPAFQQVWQINKTQVAVCQDCEFRFICTDCRAYTQNAQPLGKPAKCRYDPYTATWATT